MSGNSSIHPFIPEEAEAVAVVVVVKLFLSNFRYHKPFFSPLEIASFLFHHLCSFPFLPPLAERSSAAVLAFCEVEGAGEEVG